MMMASQIRPSHPNLAFVCAHIGKAAPTEMDMELAIYEACNLGRADIVRAIYGHIGAFIYAPKIARTIFEIGCRINNQDLINFALACWRVTGRKLEYLIGDGFLSACNGGHIGIVREMQALLSDNTTCGPLGYRIAITRGDTALMQYFEASNADCRISCYIGALPMIIESGDYERVRAAIAIIDTQETETPDWLTCLRAALNNPIEPILELIRDRLHPDVIQHTRANYVVPRFQTLCKGPALHLLRFARAICSFGWTITANDLQDHNELIEIARDLRCLAE